MTYREFCTALWAALILIILGLSVWAYRWEYSHPINPRAVRHVLSNQSNNH